MTGKAARFIAALFIAGAALADAIVVVANTSASDDEGVSLTATHLLMYGPNPVPKPPQKIAQYAWAPGMTYAVGQFGKGFNGARIAEIKKSAIKSESYGGYDRILSTLADEALGVFDEQYGDQ